MTKEIFGLSGLEEELATKEAELSNSEIEARIKSDGNDEYEEMVDNALAFGEDY